MLSYRSPLPRTRFCGRSAWNGFSALGIPSAFIICIQSHDSVSHQQTVLTKCMFLLAVTGDVRTLLLCYRANHHKLFTEDLFWAITHMVPLPHTRTDQVDTGCCLLTLVLASYPVESQPEQHYFVLLTVISLSHFCQMSDGARLGNDRSLPDPFQFVFSNHHTSKAI